MICTLLWLVAVVMSVGSYKILRLKCCREWRGGGEEVRSQRKYLINGAHNDNLDEKMTVCPSVNYRI